MQKKNKLGRLYLVFVFLVLYLPIAYLIYFSFSTGSTMNTFKQFNGIIVHFLHFANQVW